jgi:hypothetical protein
LHAEAEGCRVAPALGFRTPSLRLRDFPAWNKGEKVKIEVQLRQGEDGVREENMAKVPVLGKPTWFPGDPDPWFPVAIAFVLEAAS